MIVFLLGSTLGQVGLASVLAIAQNLVLAIVIVVEAKRYFSLTPRD